MINLFFYQHENIIIINNKCGAVGFEPTRARISCPNRSFPCGLS